jgi:uncharacterized RDD family membrane protein YckC
MPPASYGYPPQPPNMPYMPSPTATPYTQLPNYAPPAAPYVPSYPNVGSGYYVLPTPPPVYGGYYAPYQDSSELAHYHPLLKGAIGLPHDCYRDPRLFYSFVTSQNQIAVVRRANFWPRAGAMLIDFIILFLPDIVLIFLYGLTARTSTNFRSSSSSATEVPLWFYLAFYLLNCGYFFFGALRGSTFGKKLLHLRIIRLDGNKPDWFTAFLRQVCGYFLSSSVGILLFVLTSVVILLNREASPLILIPIPILFLGFMWAGWDSKRQAWHDKLARTLVVEDIIWLEGQNFGLPSRPQ